MTLINLTNIFTQPLSAVPQKPQANFKGTGVNNIGTADFFNFGIQESNRDKFASNPFGTNFDNKAKIEQLAKSNPRIMALLKEHNLPLKVNMEALEDMR